MRRLLMFVCISAVWCSNNKASSQTAEFIPTLVVGANENAPIEAMLTASPLFVITDQQDRIIVGDAGGAKIRAYNPDGSFLYVIDNRGSGPGEIQRISTGYVLETELWLADESNARLSIFDVETGRFIESHLLSGVGMPKRALPVSSGVLLVLKRLDPETGRYLMMHEVDPVQGAILGSFGPFDDLWSIDSEYRDEVGGIVPGNVCLTRSGELFYAPALYSGEVFGFERHEAGWVETPKLNGHLLFDDPYSIEEDGLEFKSESRGLFCLDDGHVLHFSMQWEEHKQLIAELFAANGQWLDAAPVNGIVFPRREFWDFNVNVSAVDSQGRFFVTDASQSGYPRTKSGQTGVGLAERSLKPASVDY